MNIKAIVLDIDGTLLNDAKEISQRTRQRLIEAQARGIYVILASGRPLKSMWKYAELLKMKNYKSFLISYNGAKITNCTSGKEIFSQTMTVEEGKAVLSHLENFDLKVMIEKEDYLFVEDVYDSDLFLKGKPFNIIQYEARSGGFKLCEVTNFADFLDFPLHKILIAGEPGYLRKNIEKIASPFYHQLASCFTADFYYEFTPKNIDKAFAIRKLAEELKISTSEMVAFGDGENDASMLEAVGLGVAMGNAVERLKLFADEITLSNNEDGIPFLLERIL